MELDLKTEQDVLVVRVLSARMYAVDASSFREQILAEVDAGNGDILFDLSAVQYIDSTSLGALVSVLKRVGNAGRVLIASPGEEERHPAGAPAGSRGEGRPGGSPGPGRVRARSPCPARNCSRLCAGPYSGSGAARRPDRADQVDSRPAGLRPERSALAAGAWYGAGADGRGQAPPDGGGECPRAGAPPLVLRRRACSLCIHRARRAT